MARNRMELAVRGYFAERDFEHNHENRKPYGVFGQPGKQGGDAGKNIIKTGKSGFEGREVILHLICGADGVDRFYQTGKDEPYAAKMLQKGPDDGFGLLCAHRPHRQQRPDDGERNEEYRK